MISYSNLGKAGHGNLGNQLFQIASVMGLAERFKTQASFPEWKYEYAFKNKLPHNGMALQMVKEKEFNYNPDQFKADCDISGWLQSEKYFGSFRFEFTDEIINEVKPLIKGKTIAISVRRGDYVGNPNYVLLDPGYYLAALQMIPNWREYQIMIFSDDLDYCRLHFQCLPNVLFIELEPIKQLALMSLCTHFVVSNSTFAWWGAYLGQKPTSIVIRPDCLFAGSLSITHDEFDFYPINWVLCEHNKRIDLTDVTFTIPVYYDHDHRKENIELCIYMLLKYFNTNIVVMENKGSAFKYLSRFVKYVKSDHRYFHRTRMLNDMARECNTPIVFNWDADVVISPAQILEAVNALRSDADMVYPYDGRFARVQRLYLPDIIKLKDVGAVKGIIFTGMREKDFQSVGGAVGFKTKSFFAGGGENEKFISYGPEDAERFYRFTKLGFDVRRIKGVLYHIDHYISENSGKKHPNYDANVKEWERIRNMNTAQLQKQFTL